MITRISITQNPVKNWEQFSLDLHYGNDRASFSKAIVEHHAMGGFWAASFTMNNDETTLRMFFEGGLGREVQFKNENGGIDFEGFINTMTLTGLGASKITTSLDNMKNDILVRYKDAAGTFARATEAQDTDSQDRYGIKEYVLSAGQLTATSIADNLATLVLRRYRWPKQVPEDLRLGGELQQPRYIEVQCLGYVHTLEWRTYNQTASTGTQSADLQLADIIASVGQFVAENAFKANPLGVTKEYDADRDAQAICFDIARLGDSQNPPQRWVLYMKEGRRLVYEPAAPEQLISG